MRQHEAEARQAAAASKAVERVLRAERRGQQLLEEARRQAQARLDAAREEGLAIVNRSMERAALWQQHHAAALQLRLRQLQASSAASALAHPTPDDAAIAAAVKQVAALLTGGAEGVEGAEGAGGADA